jgi:hypothetical protein
MRNPNYRLQRSPRIERDRLRLARRADAPLVARNYCDEITDEDAALVMERYSPKPDGKAAKAAAEVER